ncbi:hypothetical protein GOV04_03300 [Candidatus Woesearchaeota archaeon]|nr:hypothetical protein [Candidatus Woesearchaeota archaeon]
MTLKKTILIILLLALVCFSVVAEYTSIQSLLYLEQISDLKEKITVLNIPAQRISDLESQAKLEHQQQNYDAVAQYFFQTQKIYDAGLKANRLLLSYEDNLNIIKPQNESFNQFLTIAKQEYYFENFEQTVTVLEVASNDLLGQTFISPSTTKLELLKLQKAETSLGLQPIIAGSIANYKTVFASFDYQRIKIAYQDYKQTTNTLLLLNTSKYYIDGLSGNNVSTSRLEDTYYLAVVQYNNGQILAAKDFAMQTINVYELFLSTKNILSKTNTSLQALKNDGKTITEDFLTYQKALEEFRAQNYESASQELTTLHNSLEQRRTEGLVGLIDGDRSNNLAILVANNKLISVALFVILLVIIVIGQVFFRKHARTQLEKLYLRKIDALTDSVKKLQREYFKDRSLSRSDYDTLLDDFEQKKAVLEEKLVMFDRNRKK